MYSVKQQKRRGTEKTQRLSSQMPHKLVKDQDWKKTDGWNH